MCATCDRRLVLVAGLAALAAPGGAAARDLREAFYLAEAERMRREAVARGDQSYGAVLVLAGAIVGYGPSRVVVDGDDDAHAERVAIWAAQRTLGRADLTGAVLYSTSRPCRACEVAAADAGVARMIHGAGTDAGPPRRR